jgi:hypothetical protein
MDDTRPVILGPLIKPITCEGCRRAWIYYKKAQRRIKLFRSGGSNEKEKHLIRKATWFEIKAAKLLHEDRGNHLWRRGEHRQVPLHIASGMARKIVNRKCWSCGAGLLAHWGGYHETLFCGRCFSIQYNDYVYGAVDLKEIQRIYKSMKNNYHGEPLWTKFRWSKKKNDMVARGAKEI